MFLVERPESVSEEEGRATERVSETDEEKSRISGLSWPRWILRVGEETLSGLEVLAGLLKNSRSEPAHFFFGVDWISRII